MARVSLSGRRETIPETVMVVRTEVLRDPLSWRVLSVLTRRTPYDLAADQASAPLTLVVVLTTTERSDDLTSEPGVTLASTS